MSGVLTTRHLNRALLARQFLLTRASIPPLSAITALAGLQAQVARPPFIGLWSRLASFTRADLLSLIHGKQVVRVTAMRGTLHLLAADDYRAWRGVLQPGLEKGLRAIGGATLNDIDLAAVEDAARAFFARPAPFDAFRDHLSTVVPAEAVRMAAYAIRLRVPLVQVPVDGDRWGYPAQAGFVLADRWLEAPVPTAATPADALVLRYLAAFGPASVADAQAWSGLPGLADTFARLRPSLLVFRDERKRELFDLPDAPRPDPDTQAPVRLIADYDNLLLAHADRRRIVDDEHRGKITSKNLHVQATFLVDGMVAGLWKVERKKAAADIVFTPFVPLSKRVAAELEREADAWKKMEDL